MKGSLLVIVPRVNLVADISERIGPETSVYCASLKRKEIGKITVATIQSIGKKSVTFDCVIFDEVHNYKDEVLDSFDCRFKIGLTATPFTSSGWIYE